MEVVDEGKTYPMEVVEVVDEGKTYPMEEVVEVVHASRKHIDIALGSRCRGFYSAHTTDTCPNCMD